MPVLHGLWPASDWCCWWAQGQTRMLRGINVAATTDIRIMAREDWGQKPYHNYSHEEIMNSITIDGYAVPPERVGLHILDPSASPPLTGRCTALVHRFLSQTFEDQQWRC